MIAQFKGVYIGSNNGSFTNQENGKVINYTHVMVACVDEEKKGDVHTFSLLNSIDISPLQLYKEYLFLVDIPKKLRENGKIKIVGVLQAQK